MIKEACVESFREALLAQKNGADRIELCSDLANEGLSPSVTLMQQTCESLDIPVMVMVRPRAGNFVYTSAEIEQMKEAIDAAKKAGAYGVVLGLLTPENKIDRENTSTLAEYAQPLPVTFHKAIDEMDDPAEGVRQLKTIPGIKRILTSGGKATAMEGSEVLKQMMCEAGNEITILVAGKVMNCNVEEHQRITGATEFHGRKIVGDLSV